MDRKKLTEEIAFGALLVISAILITLMVVATG